MRISGDLLIPKGFWRNLWRLLWLTAIFASTLLSQEIRVKELARLCKARDANACALLAVCHEYGIDTDRNEKTALKFYRQACLLGDGTSCRIMGYKSVLKPRDAAFYFHEGCRRNDQKSCVEKESLKN